MLKDGVQPWRLSRTQPTIPNERMKGLGGFGWRLLHIDEKIRASFTAIDLSGSMTVQGLFYGLGISSRKHYQQNA